VKTKHAGSDHRRDFAKKLADHLSNDRRIIRLRMIDTKIHQLAGCGSSDPSG
jgi:hypothetical protein